MYKQVNIYPSKTEAIRRGVYPYIPNEQRRCDLAHLEDNLLIEYYDDADRLIGYGIERVSEDVFNELLAEAMELAGW